MKQIYDVCIPKSDVRAGKTRDEQFAADLSQIIQNVAPREYSDPETFFKNTHPTEGIKTLLRTVATRVSGEGGEVASIFRLDTQYGGGKTHALISLVHALRNGRQVENIQEFIDPTLLPTGPIRIAVLDGENSDPANGVKLEADLKAFSLWGELAYALKGAEGYRSVQKSDQEHIAPGTPNLIELLAGGPCLILIDELSVYLRKAEAAFPNKADQLTAFLHALFKAVESTSNVAVVMTLAMSRTGAHDAYSEEQERLRKAFDESSSVIARKATILNPTTEDETAAVLRRRLFERVDESAVKEAIDAYRQCWERDRDSISGETLSAETLDQFRRGYPLHPDLIQLMTNKLSSLDTFQRTRGMLRILARTIHRLWAEKPEAFAIHPHHIDLAFQAIRDEVTTRMNQGSLAPALKADVAAVENDLPATAERLDSEFYSGQAPLTLFLARTIFLNTLSYPEETRGIGKEHLKYSLLSPGLQAAFIDQALTRFIEEAQYLDDRPNSPYRFMAQPNLEQVIRKRMRDLNPDEVRSRLNEQIQRLFTGTTFDLMAFPGGPYQIPDGDSKSRPVLVLMAYDHIAVSGEPDGIHPSIEEIFEKKGTDGQPRMNKNQLVFLVAELSEVDRMRMKTRRHLALTQLLDAMRSDPGILERHQWERVKEYAKRSENEIAVAIQQCYRHVFFPFRLPLTGAKVPLAHLMIDLPAAAVQPGDGQSQIRIALKNAQKLKEDSDSLEAPNYVKDKLMVGRQELSVAALREEFRRSPSLSMLLSDQPFIRMIREGIETEVFIYRKGDQVWGKGDITPDIQMSDEVFVLTLQKARELRLWPRPEPLKAEFHCDRDAFGWNLLLEISGGIEPYTYSCQTEERFNLGPTTQTAISVGVMPQVSTVYSVLVTDSRGNQARTEIHVEPFTANETGSTQTEMPLASAMNSNAARSKATYHEEGSLQVVLPALWKRLRNDQVEVVASLKITFFNALDAFKVFQALATLRDYEILVNLKGDMTGDEVQHLEVNYSGSFSRSTQVKSFIEAQLRSVTESSVTLSVSLRPIGGLQMNGDAPEKLLADLTVYGGNEAYVEAFTAGED